jgi:hypothetical protein
MAEIAFETPQDLLQNANNLQVNQNTHSLQKLKRQLTKSQIRMLAVHAASENHSLSLSQLRDAGGYHSSADALFAYTDMARKYSETAQDMRDHGIAGLGYLDILVDPDQSQLYDELCLRQSIAEAVIDMEWL